MKQLPQVDHQARGTSNPDLVPSAWCLKQQRRNRQKPAESDQVGDRGHEEFGTESGVLNGQVRRVEIRQLLTGAANGSPSL
jgi:hypothetical protein